MDRHTLRSPLALTVLGLLFEEPMHPYRMQQLIRDRDKDEVVNARSRTSLYRTIARLERAGLVANRGTARAEHRPERTVYGLTDAGQEALVTWLRDMLANLAPEFPTFPVALAHLPLLAHDDVTRQLARRVEALAAEIDRIDGRLRIAAHMALPRIFVVELEYARAGRQAELDWTRAIVDDLRSGRLRWDAELLDQFRGQPAPPPTACEEEAPMA